MVTSDPRQLTYDLVVSYLRDNNYLNTLQCFLQEVSESEYRLQAPQDINNTIDPITITPPQSLISIVEEHQQRLQLLERQQKSQSSSGELDTSFDENNLVHGDGLYPTTEDKIYPTIHTLNIIAIKSLNLPKPYFPEISSSESSETTTIPVIISGSADKSLRLTHATTGDLLDIYTHHQSAILDIQPHPTRPNILATTSMDGTFALLDLETHSVLQQPHHHTKYVTRVRFSPCGKWLITGSYDKTINIYHSNDSTYTKHHTQQFHGAIESIAFIPNTTTAIIGTRDDSYLHFITCDSVNPISHVAYNMNSNNDTWVSFCPMTIHVLPTGTHMLVQTDFKSGRIILFRVPQNLNSESPKPLHIVRNYYGPQCDEFSQPQMTVSDSGKYFYVTSDDWSIWGFETFPPLQRRGQDAVVRLKGHTGVIRGLDYDNENKWLVSCGFDKTIRVWK